METGNTHIIIKLTLGSVHVVLAVPPRREGGGQVFMLDWIEIR